MITHQQELSTWLSWRTWNLSRFISSKFLHPAKWAMDLSLMWWSWKYERVSPQVTIRVAPHTQQVTWYLTSVFLLSTTVEILLYQFDVVILHSLFWWLLQLGPKLNDRDHHWSVHRPHLHHHLCFYYCLQRQKQVTRLSDCIADCLYEGCSHRLAKALPWCLCNFV